MDNYRLLDDKTILDQLPDVLPGVGVGKLADLVRIHPHLELDRNKHSVKIYKYIVGKLADLNRIKPHLGLNG